MYEVVLQVEERGGNASELRRYLLELGRQLGASVDPYTGDEISRWCHGHRPIPALVASLLADDLLGFIEESTDTRMLDVSRRRFSAWFVATGTRAWSAPFAELLDQLLWTEGRGRQSDWKPRFRVSDLSQALGHDDYFATTQMLAGELDYTPSQLEKVREWVSNELKDEPAGKVAAGGVAALPIELADLVRSNIKNASGWIPAGVARPTHLDAASVVERDLLLPTPFESSHPPDKENTKLIDHILSRLDNSRIVVLGPAGIGKTMTAIRLLQRLGAAFHEMPSTRPLPRLLKLDSIDRTATSDSTRSAAELLRWAGVPDYAVKAWMTVPDAPRPILILDGLDEMSLRIHAPDIRDSLQCLPLATPLVITSRSDFYTTYVSETRFDTSIDERIELLPLGYGPSTREFILRFCAEIGSPHGEAIAESIERDEDLREMASIPLLLHMTIDVLDDHLETTPGAALPSLSKSDLYHRYTHRWLVREYEKRNSLLAARDKWVLLRHLARLMFLGRHEDQKRLRSRDLTASGSQIHAAIGLAESTWSFGANNHLLFEEVVKRTFLVQTADPSISRYRFVHKSFYEFLVATDLIALVTAEQRTETQLAQLTELLAYPLPDPIVFFVRQMLDECSRDQELANRTASALLEVFDNSHQTRDPDDTLESGARQHAANLLALIANRRYLTELEQRLITEKSQFVRRGIIVGLAMHDHQTDRLTAYVQQLETDEHAARVQIGYTRIYRGDQSNWDRWLDDGTEPVGNTMRATIAGLSGWGRYPTLAPLSAWILRHLVEDGRGQRWLDAHPRERQDLCSRLSSGLSDANWTGIPDPARAQTEETYAEQSERLRVSLGQEIDS